MVYYKSTYEPNGELKSLPNWVPMVHTVRMFSDKWLSRYGLLENFNTDILLFEDVLDFDL